MQHLRIVYDIKGWAYYYRCQSLIKYVPEDFIVTSSPSDSNNLPVILGDTEPDFLFILDNGLTKRIHNELQIRGWHTKLIVAWSNGWSMRADWFEETYHLANHLIINNQQAWNGFGRLPRTTMITNGVDLDTFCVVNPRLDRNHKVVWVGSVFHKKIKGYDELILPLEKLLAEHQIDFDFRLVDSFNSEKLTQPEMAKFFNNSTIYVCVSQSEGTPNTALEAAACGCTVVSTAVGNMPQLIEDGVNGRLVDRQPEAVLNGIMDAIHNYEQYSEQMLQTIQSWSWKSRAADYYVTLRNLPAQTRSKLDLTDKVTVFLTTVGSPSYEYCLSRVQQQSCIFKLVVLEYIAPMSASYQCMLDQCETPYYIQLDEDMLLHPFAIEVLYHKIEKADERTAMVVAELFDCHLERPIYGIKIFRHDIVKNYPFVNIEATDVDQNNRMQAAGYTIQALKLEDNEASPNGVVGLHGVIYTDLSMYIRYAVQKRKYRRRPQKEDWYLPHEKEFFDRFLESPNRKNFFALMGSLAGTLWPLSDDQEKDWRSFSSTPGYDQLDQFYKLFTKSDKGDGNGY